MVRRSSRRSRRRSLKGGEGGEKEMMTRPMGMEGGALHPLNPAPAQYGGVPSQYYSINGGARKTRRRKGKKGGSVIATAAVPFGLFALQRYFQKKRGTHKRSFRRRH